MTEEEQVTLLAKWKALLAKELAETHQEVAAMLEEMAERDDIRTLTAPVAVRAIAILLRQHATAVLAAAPAENLFEEVGALIATCARLQKEVVACAAGPLNGRQPATDAPPVIEMVETYRGPVTVSVGRRSNDPIGDDALADLERLLEEATPGEWVVGDNRFPRNEGDIVSWDKHARDYDTVFAGVAIDGYNPPLSGRQEDKALVVALRNAAPALLAELRELRAKLKGAS